MATSTTKKASTTTTKTETELNKKVAEQQAMIAELNAKLEALLNATAQTSQPTPSKNTKMITFINLMPGDIVLRGSGSKVWKIEGQFTKRSFTEAEASVIVSNMNTFIQNGAVYITDAQFIEEHNLTDVFNNILSDKVLKTILEQDSNKVVELYMEASDLQKQVIVGMIENRIEDGREVDSNILAKIGRLCKKDLIGLANEAEEDAKTHIE